MKSPLKWHNRSEKSLASQFLVRFFEDNARPSREETLPHVLRRTLKRKSLISFFLS